MENVCEIQEWDSFLHSFRIFQFIHSIRRFTMRSKFLKILAMSKLNAEKLHNSTEYIVNAPRLFGPPASSSEPVPIHIYMCLYSNLMLYKVSCFLSILRIDILQKKAFIFYCQRLIPLIYKLISMPNIAAISAKNPLDSARPCARDIFRASSVERKYEIT